MSYISKLVSLLIATNSCGEYAETGIQVISGSLQDQLTMLNTRAHFRNNTKGQLQVDLPPLSNAL